MAAMEQTILKYFHSRTVIYQHSYHYDLRCHFFIACIGYVHRRIQAWYEADDRRNEGRVIAPVAPCKLM